jgi:hypothetical protein
MLIHVLWIDESGLERLTRFETEYAALQFEQSLDAEGLHHERLQ